MLINKLYGTILLILFTFCGYSQAIPKVAGGKIESKLYDGILTKNSEIKRTEYIDIQPNTVITKEEFSGLEIVKGKIYLTGPGFPNVIMIEMPCTSDISEYSYFNGSKVVFDNCIFRNRNQSLTPPISKAYRITMKETISATPQKRH